MNLLIAIVATFGMLAVGWLVWRLLQRQETQRDDKPTEESGRTGE